ncbi:MAG: HDOD domain-containing protein [Calditrichae bacterium]|nr:HDOD domain-containing protein [Calditrichia bacterium]
MRKILLLNNEKMVIEAYEDAIQSGDKRWAIHLADNDIQALKIIESENIEAIISTPIIQNTDVVGLFNIIKERHPQIIRVLQSNLLESTAIQKELLKKFKSTHMLLIRGLFDFKQFMQDLENIFQYSALISNGKLKNLVSNINSLPSLPELYIRINEKLNTEDASLREIAGIIKHDVSMTAEILKVVNSSLFGFANKISSIEQAVALLGIEMIKTLVLSLKLFSQFPRMDQISVSIDELWDHSFLTAVFAGRIAFAVTKDKNVQENAFTAGLLHDIGMITLASQMPQTYKKAYEDAFINKTPINYSENKFFEVSHCEVGAYLAGLWSLPLDICRSIARHHLPDVSENEPDILTLAVHCADVFAQSLKDKNQGLPLEELNPQLNHIELFMDNHEQWFSMCEEIIESENNNSKT